MIRSEQDGRVRRITLASPLHRNVISSESSRAFLDELVPRLRERVDGIARSIDGKAL